MSSLFMQRKTSTRKDRAPAGAKSSKVKGERRKQAERSATTTRKLLNAAVQCLTETGYQHLTVDLVAKKARVSRGAVQHHFGSRDDLILAVVNDIGLSLSVSDTDLRSLTTLKRIEVLIEHDWAVFSSPHFIAVIQIWLAERGNPSLFDKIRRTVTRVEKKLDERWTDTFNDQPIPADTVIALRHVVIAALRGLALRTLYSGNKGVALELSALKTMAQEFIGKRN